MRARAGRVCCLETVGSEAPLCACQGSRCYVYGKGCSLWGPLCTARRPWLGSPSFPDCFCIKHASYIIPHFTCTECYCICINGRILGSQGIRKLGRIMVH